MIKDLIIQGFRGIRDFNLRQLGRVNLLVGTNNCGKTSILEAIQIFGSRGDLSSIWDIARRRGEIIFDNTDMGRTLSSLADVCHFFHGHEIDDSSQFRILARTESDDESLTAAVDTSRKSADADDFPEAPNRVLNFDWSKGVNCSVRLQRGVSAQSLMRKSLGRAANGTLRVSFISTAGLAIDDIVSMFDDVVLTQEEAQVVEALRTIEPTIERLASVRDDARRGFLGERGGIVVKCNDSSQRVPIGSMGDGMWRMLGLALALASVQNGILLVDEIDTGLHFSVLEKMWKLVDEASRRLNVQVFATTHSRDAYESLAAICRDSVSDRSEVTIQRIDRIKSKSVPFTEQEIIAASERGMEVR